MKPQNDYDKIKKVLDENKIDYTAKLELLPSGGYIIKLTIKSVHMFDKDGKAMQTFV